MIKKLMAFTALTLSVGANAAPVNLVTNGGFESGDLSGWSCTTNAIGSCGIGDNPNTGGSNFQGYDNTDFGTLSQAIATVGGESYNFSFFSNNAFFSQGNILRYQIGSDPIADVTRTDTYAQTSTSFLATGTSTDISFLFETNTATGSWEIDDVSVVSAVPLPAAAWLFGSALLGLGVVKRRKS
jgi:hypothetical protein